MSVTPERNATNDSDLRETNVHVDNINDKIGEAQATPSQYTLLDRVKILSEKIGDVGTADTILQLLDIISTNTGTVGSSNFTATNSANVNLSKTDLDSILTKIGDVSTAATILKLLNDIATNTGTVGSSNFTATNSTNVDSSKVDLDSILTKIGDVSTAATILKLLNDIVTNTGTSTHSNFTATNSTNVDLSKSDLDSILAKIGDTSTAATILKIISDILAASNTIASNTSNSIAALSQETIGVGSVYGSITVSNIATEFKVGSNKLANRKCVILDNTSSADIYVGFNSSVSTSNGLIIPGGTTRTFYLNPSQSQALYGIATANIANIPLAELM